MPLGELRGDTKIMKIFRLLGVALTLFISSSIVSCSEDAGLDNAEINIFETSLDIYEGQTGHLGYAATMTESQKLTWGSTDPSIVEIDSETGEYKAIAPGMCKIYAKIMIGEYETPYNYITDFCFVTVHPISITIEPSNKAMAVGEKFKFTVNTTPEDISLSHDFIEWSSSNTDIATVDKDGTVTAIKEGKCEIVATTTSGTRDSSTVTVTPQDNFHLNTNSITLSIGEKYTITVTKMPESCETVSWSSSHSAVATVDQNGKVHANALGQCTITATTDGGHEAMCVVNVVNGHQDDITSLSLDCTEKTAFVGEKFKLTATFTPENATPPDIYWHSTDKSIATVDDDGNVTTIKEGECIIRASISRFGYVHFYDECKLTVLPTEVESITFDVEEKILAIGEEFTLTVSITPTNATTDIVWTSSNPDIATVNEEGVITALQEGECSIYATTSNDKVAECKITVVIVDIESIAFDVKEHTIEVGEELQLVVTFTPSNATFKDLTWVSSDSDVATVSQDGIVVGKAVGECTIYAASVNNKIIECTVAVTPAKIKSVSFKNSSYKLLVGDTIQAELNVDPIYAEVTDIKWIIDDKSIATITDDGIITCHSLGTTKLTAIVNGEFMTTCDVRGCTVDNFIGLLLTSCSVINNNGYVMGSFMHKVSNYSSYDVKLKEVQIINSSTNSVTSIVSFNSILKAYMEYSMTININSYTYQPSLRWVFEYNGEEFTKTTNIRL